MKMGFFANADKEKEFRNWYDVRAGKAGINPNPDDPNHHYDYRSAFLAGTEPEISPEDGRYHWDSKFKTEDHPNRYVKGEDTITGEQTDFAKKILGNPDIRDIYRKTYADKMSIVDFVRKMYTKHGEDSLKPDFISRIKGGLRKASEMLRLPQLQEEYGKQMSQGQELMNEPLIKQNEEGNPYLNLNPAMGALQYTFSPINAGAKTFLGDPIRETGEQAGIDPRASDFVAQMAEIGTPDPTDMARIAPMLAGAIKIPTLVKGQNRFLRGGSAQGRDVYEHVSQFGDDIIRPEVDQVSSMAEAVSKAKSMHFIEPDLIEKQTQGRYRKKGQMGNEKMRHPNASFPEGRQTVEWSGCGRGKFCSENDLIGGACYGGDCYAEAIGRTKGQSVVSGTTALPLRQSDPMVKTVKSMVETEGIEKTAELFPQFIIKHYPDMDKVTVRPAPVGRPATPVTANIDPKHVTGKDMRLGVDADGGAWISRPDVMDALLKANPRTVTVYSSAYHTPPPPHPLSGRTTVNVTVSGWHSVPETIKRLEWAKTARDNGWNVILREVTADPSVFPENVDRYNRIHQMIRDTDFYIMEQPLHRGKKTGHALEKDMPACCSFGNCGNCEVAEGTGKKFRDYWEIDEKTKGDEPWYPDLPNEMKDIDKRTMLLRQKREMQEGIVKKETRPAMGINVATDKKAGRSYADLIVDGKKKFETRDSDSLREYVGKRMAIVKTGSGQAKAIGEVTIGEPIRVDQKKFRAMEKDHLVPQGSTFDIKSGEKWMYPVSDPVRFDKEFDVAHGIKARKILYKGGK